MNLYEFGFFFNSCSQVFFRLERDKDSSLLTPPLFFLFCLFFGCFVSRKVVVSVSIHTSE